MAATPESQNQEKNKSLMSVLHRSAIFRFKFQLLTGCILEANAGGQAHF
jgi:hypothetical protein